MEGIDMLYLVGGISLLAILMAKWMLDRVMQGEEGTPRMKEIALAIQEGANAFLQRQYTSIGSIGIIIALVILIGYTWWGNFNLAFVTTISFILGAFSSGLAGYVSMRVAVKANLRTATAANEGLNEAFLAAFRGGAVSGLVILALSLLGISILFFVFSGDDPMEAPLKIVGFGFGASLIALFAQLGGGIYTKAADVGADMVGKLEAGIPEDDPRNPAVIADLVGDNVGDCAGRGADLFESTAAENIGAMILGVALFPIFGIAGILFPLVAMALGLVASVVGIMSVRISHQENPMKAMKRGYWLTTLLAAVLLYAAVYVYLDNNLLLFGAGIIGLLTGLAMVYITMHYTERDSQPVKDIAAASETGAGTNVIAGLAVGMETTALPAVVLGVALLVSFALGDATSLPQGGLFGTAMATIGMLLTAGYVLAMDNFGPISDNAGGIVEMSHAPEKVRAITDRLDAAGNTTKALTKGYAIGSAGLAAFLLFSAYMVETGLVVINLASLPVFVGGMMGAMLVFLFSSFAMRAVGRAAGAIAQEVRRQFREIKGIMQGKTKPDYAKAVDIATQSALKEMVLPSLLVVGLTLGVGMILGAEAAGAYILVTTLTGIMLALTLNNAGGAWDNAKKYIESGPHGGKGSDAHKAAVVGDTVGDPAKDTAGPSLHVVIKLVGTLSLVLAPLFLL
ncbi:MAG: sodium-translocating pyrophosphatase [Candidatus Diapherotrites archaeon]|nr:sodium-translocating pyrophosphatase [Candidatus Diapherotrites archaeon]